MAKTLTTTADVIEELGGSKEVAALFDHHPNAVSVWRTKGVFPAHTFLVLTDALERRGAHAPRTLWGFTPIVAGEGTRDEALTPQGATA